MPLAARHAARRGRAASLAAADAAAIPDSALRALRPRHGAGQRHARAVRELAGGPGGAGPRLGPAAGRAGAAAGGRRRPAHAGRERAARRRRPFPHAQLVVAPDTGHSAIGADCLRLRAARVRALLPAPAGAGGCRRGAALLPGRAAAAQAAGGRPAAARDARRARQDARRDEADAPRRGRGLAHGARLRPRARRDSGARRRACARGHYAIGSGRHARAAAAWRMCPGVTVTGRIGRSSSAAVRAACGSAGARARAASLRIDALPHRRAPAEAAACSAEPQGHR